MPFPKMVRFVFDICTFACIVFSAIAWGYGYNNFIIPMSLCGVGLALSIVCHNIKGA